MAAGSFAEVADQSTWRVCRAMHAVTCAHMVLSLLEDDVRKAQGRGAGYKGIVTDLATGTRYRLFGPPCGDAACECRPLVIEVPMRCAEHTGPAGQITTAVRRQHLKRVAVIAKRLRAALAQQTRAYANLLHEHSQLIQLNRLMTDRERRILELKDEVNALLHEFGRPTKYHR